MTRVVSFLFVVFDVHSERLTDDRLCFVRLSLQNASAADGCVDECAENYWEAIDCFDAPRVQDTIQRRRG